MFGKAVGGAGVGGRWGVGGEGGRKGGGVARIGQREQGMSSGDKAGQLDVMGSI